MLNSDHLFSLVTALACPVLNGFCVRTGQSRMAICFVPLFIAGGMDVLSSTAAGKQPEWILVLSRLYILIIQGLIVVCRPTCKPLTMAQDIWKIGPF